MIDPTEQGAAETVPETSFGPMEPIEAGDPVYAGNPCWIWHRLWKCGPQIGFWDAAQKWWQITNGKLDDYGMVRKDGAFGVGIFPSHWSSLNNVPLHHRVKGWGWMPGDDQPDAALREALEPFARACNISSASDDSNIDDTLAATKITWGDLRRARSALTPTKGR